MVVPQCEVFVQIQMEKIMNIEKYIVGWSLVVEWSDNPKPESMIDIRGDVAQVVDDYLSEIEHERACAEGVENGS